MLSFSVKTNPRSPKGISKGENHKMIEVHNSKGKTRKIKIN
uniref:Uncharacterized protein n=1 Tax=Rhizophora mucronata TaxID=61149 RepID=A0A2P2Q4L0_RHIMU